MYLRYMDVPWLERHHLGIWGLYTMAVPFKYQQLWYKYYYTESTIVQLCKHTFK